VAGSEQAGAAEFELIVDARESVVCSVSSDREIEILLRVPGKSTRMQASARCVAMSVREGRIELTTSRDLPSRPLEGCEHSSGKA
jgi:hypothetical protein